MIDFSVNSQLHYIIYIIYTSCNLIGWKQRSKCYWIKKHMELWFLIHPFILFVC